VQHSIVVEPRGLEPVRRLGSGHHDRRLEPVTYVLFSWVGLSFWERCIKQMLLTQFWSYIQGLDRYRGVIIKYSSYRAEHLRYRHMRTQMDN
jgi:hypothetical protein